MKLFFGLVGLVVALAIVVSLGRTQMKAMNRPVSASGSAPAQANTRNVRQQSEQLQNQVREQIGQELQRGADRAADVDR